MKPCDLIKMVVAQFSHVSWMERRKKEINRQRGKGKNLIFKGSVPFIEQISIFKIFKNEITVNSREYSLNIYKQLLLAWLIIIMLWNLSISRVHFFFFFFNNFLYEKKFLSKFIKIIPNNEIKKVCPSSVPSYPTLNFMFSIS